MPTVSIARNFSDTPGGRTDKDGVHNGQRFRERFLEPALKALGKTSINLDGVAGLPGSFCDEAFGRLIRIHRLTRDQFFEKFEFVGSDDELPINRGIILVYVNRSLEKVAQGLE